MITEAGLAALPAAEFVIRVTEPSYVDGVGPTQYLRPGDTYVVTAHAGVRAEITIRRAG